MEFAENEVDGNICNHINIGQNEETKSKPQLWELSTIIYSLKVTNMIFKK